MCSAGDQWRLYGDRMGPERQRCLCSAGDQWRLYGDRMGTCEVKVGSEGSSLGGTKQQHPDTFHAL